MSLIRWFAALAAALLVSGMSCTPVYSDRPLGTAPYVAWPGLEYGQAAALNGLWMLDAPDSLVGDGFVAFFDPEANRYRVARPDLDQRLGDPFGKDPTEVEIRVHQSGGRTWLFFSEEDREQPGTFLWALARQYNPDMFVLWYTNMRNSVFEAMVRDGRLPGKVVPRRSGRSGIVGDVEQTVILQGIDGAGLDFIIEHRYELFELDSPRLLTRIRRLPPMPSREEHDTAVPPARAAPAASSP
jgi:hypothetical protein